MNEAAYRPSSAFPDSKPHYEILDGLRGTAAYFVQGGVKWDRTPVAVSLVMLALRLLLFIVPYIPGKSPVCLNAVYEMFCIMAVFPLIVCMAVSSGTAGREEREK